MTVTQQESVASVDEYLPATPPRGLVVLVQGRADAASYYARFGRRLAADGYIVRVSNAAPDSAGSAAALWNAALSDPSLVERPDGPVLGVTVDAGGGFFAQALSEKLVEVRPDGVVLTGLATAGATESEGASTPVADVSFRSACPVHRGVVESAQSASQPAVSSDQISPVLPGHALGVPTVVIHGSADKISPLAQLRADWIAGPVELNVVTGGLHDVLNDVHHRSVAAVIVSFAERLRGDARATPIILRDSL
ncbi:MAG: alpha/beta hydrolase [Micrococcaceae bacterium]